MKKWIAIGLVVILGIAGGIFIFQGQVTPEEQVVNELEKLPVNGEETGDAAPAPTLEPEPTPVPTPTPAMALAERILFTSGRNMYTINPDGTGKVKLGQGQLPFWSPDGRRIAYIDTTRTRMGQLKVIIRVINFDGTGRIEIARGKHPLPGALQCSPGVFSIEGTIRQRIRRIRWIKDRLLAGIEGPLFWSPDGTKIAFAYRYLSILNVDETTKIDLEKRLDALGGEDALLGEGNFAWSPDSKKIAYINRYDNLIVANADGTDKTRLVANVSGPLEWSPDGTKIAFGAGFINVDGTGKVLLEGGQAARWSPDGEIIAYIQNIRRGADRLNIMNLRTGEVTTVASFERATTFGKNYSWSPDGKKILYRTWGVGFALGYHITNIKTGQTYSFGFERSRLMTKPIWSPDGERVVFTEKGYIYVINADGTGEIRIGEGTTPQWSSDGKRIVYHFTEKFGEEVLGEFIYVINVDRTDKFRLAESQGPAWWSPASP